MAMIDAVFVAATYRALGAGDGVAADAALRDVGLDRSVVEDPDARVPFRLNVAMLEAGAKHSGNSCFGLQLGAELDPKDAGVLTYVALSSETIADGLSHVRRYYHVLTDGEIMESEIDGDSLVITYRVTDPHALRSRQNNEMTLASILRVMQIGTGRRLHPEWVQFDHAEPDDISEHRRLFGAPLSFNAPSNAMVFTKAVLDLPIHSADSRLLHILEKYCEAVLKERGYGSDLMFQVQGMIVKLLPEGYPKASAVARELGMSKRTLSRRLQERGMTYRNLVDELRAALSERYLRDRSLRMSEIAYLLGYSDLSAFNHAFRRWTGTSPSEYRGAAN